MTDLERQYERKVYFSTKECAEAAIEKFGDRIKEVMA